MAKILFIGVSNIGLSVFNNKVKNYIPLLSIFTLYNLGLYGKLELLIITLR